MTTWINNDGLVVEFGTTRAEVSDGGAPDQSGAERLLIVDIDLTKLTTTATVFGRLEALGVPKDAIIESAKLTVLTAAAGATATLDVGLTLVDGTGGDDDGLVAAQAVASLTPAGAEITGAGALVGTVTTADLFVAASYNTAAFTAGKVRLELRFIPTKNREDQ